MSWTDFYPILDDAQVTEYEQLATLPERVELDEWCAVTRIINPRPSTHLVAVSLFWKNLTAEENDLQVLGRQQMKDAASLGLISRFAPWDHYVKPLLEGAAILQKARPEVVLRVYLAADLEFLVEDLVEVGCEVYLMTSSSIRHNPGALWRFLALEEIGKWITVIDADRGQDILGDVERTEQAIAADLGLWRVPYFYDKKNYEHDPGYYRPINACQFGAKGGQPVALLMKAFIWHNRRGTMPTTWRDPVNPNQPEGKPIAVTTWPSYGFDEWFLLAALYPRMAFEGVLTFFHWQAPVLSFCHTLDVEYVTWANPRSEVFRCPRLSGDSEEWDDGKNPGLTLRQKTTIIRREREKYGAKQDIFYQSAAPEIQEFLPFQGSLKELLASLETHVAEPWWVDLNPRLKLGKSGGELFCDRRYEKIDVVFCGHTFARITSEIAVMAKCYGLNWKEDDILKFPKLEGPMTLWKTTFSIRLYQEWQERCPTLEPGILLQAWIEQGKAKVLNTTAKQMGWSVR
jgi:hypothetical protein